MIWLKIIEGVLFGSFIATLIFAAPTTRELQNDTNNDTNYPRIVSREEWKARVVNDHVPLASSPTPYVVVHHGGIPHYCYDQETCSSIVRAYQDLHMDVNGWIDVGYQFLIAEDGNVYEGRGWDFVGAHAPGYNTQSIGICIIGDFTKFLPNTLALDALKSLIRYGVFIGKIQDDYKLIGHRQAVNYTVCPGEMFYEYVSSMPHWTSSPVPTPYHGTRRKVDNITGNSLWTDLLKLGERKRIEDSVSTENRQAENVVEANSSVEVTKIELLNVTVRQMFSSRFEVTMQGLIVITVLSIALGSAQSAKLRNTVYDEPTIIKRSEWGAREPSERIGNLAQNPVPYVVIHHSASDVCTSQAICQSRVRSFQNYHMDTKHWGDIGYNFLVGEDGNIYEGRGWNKRGAHAVDYNSKSVGICFIGNYKNRQPSNAAVKAAKNLIDHGVSQGYISQTYKLIGHKQAASTECPGTQLYEIIKTWPNWTKNP
ncbi:uncharacterized protein LOC107272405 [Cephus cinctus]|uniref:Uncharacterized protein LOC107272405 n=1 Tax=Cephus cinctus TaxID=211228 RepID=A0AAJ7FRS4_CEPCN|nr:uncharacterized protein LOC107272405 [Cephus cinctus]